MSDRFDSYVSAYIEGAVFEDGPREIAKALDRNFTSPNETDRNLEPANVVDGLFAIARAVDRLARVVEEGADDAV